MWTGGELFAASLSAEEQRLVARRLVSFLSLFSHLSDSSIIEFFTEDLWNTVPTGWQPVLQDLTPPQVADLLLDVAPDSRRYPSVWPLSLLAFRASAHALAFPRQNRRHGSRWSGLERPEEFVENQSQSSLLGHMFRKHVKPKKQHEIRRLGTLVQQLCERTACRGVVDVGSGQGHLTRFMSFGLGLSVTAVEADRDLVAMATRFDQQLQRALEKEKQKKNSASPRPLPMSSPRHINRWVNPEASWEAFIQQLGATDSHSKKQLRETVGEDHSDPDLVLTGLHACGDLSTTLLRHFVHCPHVRGITSVACCYMKLSTRENPSPPGLVDPLLAEPGPEPASLPPPHFGYPMSHWVEALPGHRLSYKAREAACHALEDYIQRLRERNPLLRTHCYRAALETIIRDARPDLRRAGIQTIKKAHLLPFTEYARRGLARVGLPPDLTLDLERVAAMLEQQGRVVVYFSLSLLLAPVVESLVLLDRMIYLQENGVDSQLVPLFDPNCSPRNLVLVALKPGGGGRAPE